MGTEGGPNKRPAGSGDDKKAKKDKKNRPQGDDVADSGIAALASGETTTQSAHASSSGSRGGATGAAAVVISAMCTICHVQCAADCSNWGRCTRNQRGKRFPDSPCCGDCDEFVLASPYTEQQVKEICAREKGRQMLQEKALDFKEGNRDSDSIAFPQASVREELICEHFFEERTPFITREEFKSTRGGGQFYPDDVGLRQGTVRNKKNKEITGILAEPATLLAPASASAGEGAGASHDTHILVSRTGKRLVLEVPLLEKDDHKYKDQAQDYYQKELESLAATHCLKWHNRYTPRVLDIPTYTDKEIRANVDRKFIEKGLPRPAAQSSVSDGQIGQSPQKQRLILMPPPTSIPSRPTPSTTAGPSLALTPVTDPSSDISGFTQELGQKLEEYAASQAVAVVGDGEEEIPNLPGPSSGKAAGTVSLPSTRFPSRTPSRSRSRSPRRRCGSIVVDQDSEEADGEWQTPLDSMALIEREKVMRVKPPTYWLRELTECGVWRSEKYLKKKTLWATACVSRNAKASPKDCALLQALVQRVQATHDLWTLLCTPGVKWCELEDKLDNCVKYKCHLEHEVHEKILAIFLTTEVVGLARQGDLATEEEIDVTVDAVIPLEPGAESEESSSFNIKQPKLNDLSLDFSKKLHLSSKILVNDIFKACMEEGEACMRLLLSINGKLLDKYRQINKKMERPPPGLIASIKTCKVALAMMKPMDADMQEGTVTAAEQSFVDMADSVLTDFHCTVINLKNAFFTDLYRDTLKNATTYVEGYDMLDGWVESVSDETQCEGVHASLKLLDDARQALPKLRNLVRAGDTFGLEIEIRSGICKHASQMKADVEAEKLEWSEYHSTRQFVIQAGETWPDDADLLALQKWADDQAKKLQQQNTHSTLSAHLKQIVETGVAEVTASQWNETMEIAKPVESVADNEELAKLLGEIVCPLRSMLLLQAKSVNARVDAFNHISRLTATGPAVLKPGPVSDLKMDTFQDEMPIWIKARNVLTSMSTLEGSANSEEKFKAGGALAELIRCVAELKKLNAAEYPDSVTELLKTAEKKVADATLEATGESRDALEAVTKSMLLEVGGDDDGKIWKENIKPEKKIKEVAKIAANALMTKDIKMFEAWADEVSNARATYVQSCKNLATGMDEELVKNADDAEALAMVSHCEWLVVALFNSKRSAAEKKTKAHQIETKLNRIRNGYEKMMLPQLKETNDGFQMDA